MEKESIAIVGLGLIGTALAKRLMSAGFEVHGYDIDTRRCDAFAKLGGRAQESLASLSETCRTILISVLNTEQVEAVVEGAATDSATAHASDALRLASRHTIVCTSTCDPDRIAALASRVAAKGVKFLEAPLSGNSDQVALGNGVGLIGGDRATVEALAPVFDAICPRRHYLGAVGSGGKAKLAVNLVGGLNRAVLAEGLAFAESIGLELIPFLEVLKSSAAYSRTMDNRGEKMARSDFTPHAKVTQSRKDFMLMHSTAERSGQALPLASVYLELIEGCIEHGEGDLDNSAIIQEVRRRRRARPAAEPR